MSQEMFYLLRAVQNPDFTQISEGVSDGGEFGLFRFNQKKPEPIVKPAEANRVGFDKPADLGVAIGRFFKSQNKAINSIAATERMGAVEFPFSLPYVVWEEPVTLYVRLNSHEYIGIIQSMTKELDGK